MSTEHTDAELRAAWQAVRRWNWPATYEQAMADAVRAAIVRGQAARTALIEAKQPAWASVLPATTARLLQAPHTRPRPATHHSPPQPAIFDRKRAASGEREEAEGDAA